MCGHPGWEAKGGMNWETGIDTYILPRTKQTTNVLYSVLRGDLNGKEIQKRRNICIRTALLYQSTLL